MYTDPQILYDSTLSLDMHARYRYFMHWYHHYTDTIVHWTWYYIIHWPLLVPVLVIHRYVTRLIATHICSTGTRIYQFTEYRMSYYCYHRYMNARYTVISCSHITVTYVPSHACTCMYCFYLLVIWITVHITCIIVLCYPCIPVIWLFPVTAIDIPVPGHMSCWYAMCGIPHLLFLFPVILFYAINRAQVLLSCHMYHALYLFLLRCVL